MIKPLGEVVHHGRYGDQSFVEPYALYKQVLEGMRACIWIKIKAGMILSYSSQQLKLSSTVRNRTLEELNFPPLPPAGGGFVVENSYALGSYEFFPVFSQDFMCFLDFRFLPPEV